MHKNQSLQPSQPTTEVGFSKEIELESYLTASFELSEAYTDGFAILQWWEQHSGKFPILAKIAKEILVSPVSTVDIEEAFNAEVGII